MERVVTIPIYETREIEPYPSHEGIRCKENITPKLAMMVKECPRFKRILEGDGGTIMIEQLHEHAIIDSNSFCYGMSAPNNFELMEKINELIDEVNMLKKKLEEE